MSNPQEPWSETHRKNLEIGVPPEGKTLTPENCFDVWPGFVLKHSLRQREGEIISEFIMRFCTNVTDTASEWEQFSCPETAQALFCLGGFRNTWLRSVVDRPCQTPKSVREIRACLFDLLPYINVGIRERRVRANRVKNGLPRKRNLTIYPWDYMRPSVGDSVFRVATTIWAARRLESGEVLTHEPLLIQ